MLFLFFFSFSSNGFDTFDAVVCEAIKDESGRIQCYRNANFKNECKNKENAKELACYKEAVTELEKKEQEEKKIQTKEKATKQAELDKKNEEQKIAKQAELEEKNKDQLAHKSLKSQKITYTPEELRNMVKSRNYPQQDTSSVKKRESIDYTACIIKIESIVAASKPNYPSETIESTDLIQIILWTNDSAMTLTCNATDNELIVTSAPYL